MAVGELDSGADRTFHHYLIGDHLHGCRCPCDHDDHRCIRWGAIIPVWGTPGLSGVILRDGLSMQRRLGKIG